MSLESHNNDNFMNISISDEDDEDFTDVILEDEKLSTINSNDGYSSSTCGPEPNQSFIQEVKQLESISSNVQCNSSIGILSGKRFILTGRIVDRDVCISTITQNGGIIFDPAAELVTTSETQTTSTTICQVESATQPNRKRHRERKRISFTTFNSYNESKSHIIENSKFTLGNKKDQNFNPQIDRRNLYIINQDGKNVLTVKYLFALAMSAVPISIGWIEKCLTLGLWKEPPLPAGFSRERVFRHSEKILIMDASPFFKKQWEVLLQEMGATILSERDLDEVQSLFLIMVETAPSYNSRRISLEYNIPIVNVKYMKRCLIRGERLPVTHDLAYNAPEESKENAIGNQLSIEAVSHVASKHKSSLRNIDFKSTFKQAQRNGCCFLGDGHKAFGNTYYKQVYNNGLLLHVNDCIFINLDVLGYSRKHRALSKENNIAMIRDIFQSDDDCLLRIQMFTRRCILEENSCENLFELYLSSDFIDGIPINAIEGHVKIYPKFAKLTQNHHKDSRSVLREVTPNPQGAVSVYNSNSNVSHSQQFQNSCPTFFCTHEIDLTTEKIIPLKQCLWRQKQEVIILDTDPQEDDTGRATFFSAISLNGQILCEHTVIHVETDTGEQHYGRITEIFQTKGSRELNLTLQLASPDFEIFHLNMRGEDDTVGLTTNDIYEVNMIQIVNDPLAFRSRDFFGNYWKLT